MAVADDAVDSVLETFTRSGAVEQARRYVKTLIDLRRVKPGERLPSATAISAKIGVSRPAVLQALKILESEGHLTVRPGRAGARVRPMEGTYREASIRRVWERRETWAQLDDYREMVDPGMAKLVARRGMPEHEVKEARRLLEAMKLADDPADYRAHDVEFHHTIARSTGSKMLEAFGLVGRKAISDVFLIVPLTPERRRSSDREHERLLNAIAAGDAKGAADIALRHAATTSKRIIDALEGDLGALPAHLYQQLQEER